MYHAYLEYVQCQNCSHKYFQEQHSSQQTAYHCSHYLGSCTHSGRFAVAAAAAATARAGDRLRSQAERPGLHPNELIQDKFNLKIFSWGGKNKQCLTSFYYLFVVIHFQLGFHQLTNTV